MRNYSVNSDRVKRFMARKELERSGKVRESVYARDKGNPRLEHVYTERGKKACLEFELKQSKMTRLDNKHWSWNR